MVKVESNMIIKNENLFRALVCMPLAVLFVLLAQHSVMSSGLVLFQVIFIVTALYFSLTSLAHTALYTNERFEGKTEPLFEDKNLSHAITFSVLTIVFVSFAAMSVTSSSHVVFQVVFILMASFVVLRTLAYAAFYTNNVHAEKTEH